MFVGIFALVFLKVFRKFGRKRHFFICQCLRWNRKFLVLQMLLFTLLLSTIYPSPVFWFMSKMVL